jgi:hypothetical protein
MFRWCFPSGCVLRVHWLWIRCLWNTSKPHTPWVQWLASVRMWYVRSQARPRVAKVAQIGVRGSQVVRNCKSLKKMEQYNDTRRWLWYEAALLMKKNEIRTDEEAPLTTPVDVCSRVLSSNPRGFRFRFQNLRRVRNSFLGKKKKLKHFLFL